MNRETPDQAVERERNVYRLQGGMERLCAALRQIQQGCDNPKDVAFKALNHKEPDPDWTAALQTHVQVPSDKEDAERWRALMKCARIRMFGSAGFDRETGKPHGDNWVHFGAEFWSTYPVPPERQADVDEGNEWGKQAFIALTDHIMAGTPTDGPEVEG
jgi:hypothetical protein